MMDIYESANYIMNNAGNLCFRDDVFYSEERTYIVKNGECLILVRAGNPAQAKEKALGRKTSE